MPLVCHSCALSKCLGPAQAHVRVTWLVNSLGWMTRRMDRCMADGRLDGCLMDAMVRYMGEFRMNEWMYGWMDEWDAHMDGWMDRYMDRWLAPWTDGWLHGPMGGSMDGGMVVGCVINGWMSVMSGGWDACFGAPHTAIPCALSPLCRHPLPAHSDSLATHGVSQSPLRA